MNNLIKLARKFIIAYDLYQEKDYSHSYSEFRKIKPDILYQTVLSATQYINHKIKNIKSSDMKYLLWPIMVNEKVEKIKMTPSHILFMKYIDYYSTAAEGRHAFVLLQDAVMNDMVKRFPDWKFQNDFTGKIYF